MEAEWRLATHSLGVVVLYMGEELHFRVFSLNWKLNFTKGSLVWTVVLEDGSLFPFVFRRDERHICNSCIMIEEKNMIL